MVPEPRRRVWFLNRYAAPDISATSVLLSDLARALSRPFDVKVIAGNAAYRGIGMDANDSTAEAFEIKRVPVPPDVGRLGQYRAYLRGARRVLASQLEPDDVVVALTDPPMLGAWVAPVVRARSAQLVQWWQDVFPDIASAHYLPPGLGRVANKPVHIWLRQRLRGAQHVVLSPQMQVRVRDMLGDAPARVIENWVPSEREDASVVDATALRTELGLSGRIVLMYSGNLGRVHDTSALIAIARAVSDSQSVSLLVQGGGAGMDKLKAVVSAERLQNVQMRDYVPAGDLPKWLRLADVHVVSLRTCMRGLSYPSKVYPILQAGRPILSIGDVDGEVAHRVRQHRLGWVSGSPKDAVAALDTGQWSREELDAAGQRSRVLFEKLDLYASAVSAWTDCIATARQGETCSN